MKPALLALAVASTFVSTASASSKLAQQVRAAATRAGFSGEVAVARHGRIVYAHGYGLANRARGSRVTLDTSFNLASMGKMFTGVAAAQLVQAGKLRFGNRIGKYLPRLPARMRSITVAQLLDHTSGLGDFFGDPGYERLRPSLTKLSAYLPLVRRERLQFKPGTRWSYSNSGFLLAGLVIEKVSGERYDAYLARHVWRPAGMSHTGCYERSRLPAFAAIGYEDGGAANTPTLAPAGTSAGGCYSSARDLLAFARALEDGRLVTRGLTKVITTSKVRAPGGRIRLRLRHPRHHDLAQRRRARGGRGARHQPYARHRRRHARQREPAARVPRRHRDAERARRAVSATGAAGEAA